MVCFHSFPRVIAQAFKKSPGFNGWDSRRQRPRSPTRCELSERVNGWKENLNHDYYFWNQRLSEDESLMSFLFKVVGIGPLPRLSLRARLWFKACRAQIFNTNHYWLPLRCSLVNRLRDWDERKVKIKGNRFIIIWVLCNFIIIILEIFFLGIYRRCPPLSRDEPSASEFLWNTMQRSPRMQRKIDDKFHLVPGRWG